MIGELHMLATTERSVAFKVLFSLTAFVAAFGLRFALDPYLPPGFPFLTFFPAVFLTAFVCGAWSGAAVAGLSAVAAWYFFIAPGASFGLTLSSAVALGFFLSIAAIDIVIIHVMRAALAKLDVERARVRQYADRQTLLMQEAQHRIANNLAVVAALLRLQRSKTVDESARRALNEAANRTNLVARIQRRLLEADVQKGTVGSTLAELAQDAVKAAGEEDRIVIAARADEFHLPQQHLTSLALVVGELVANAIEHAFPGREAGRIELDLSVDRNGAVQIRVQDDGVGPPDGFDLDGVDSMGLRIAKQFVQQLGGTLNLKSDGGTCWIIDLPDGLAENRTG